MWFQWVQINPFPSLLHHSTCCWCWCQQSWALIPITWYMWFFHQEDSVVRNKKEKSSIMLEKRTNYFFLSAEENFLLYCCIPPKKPCQALENAWCARQKGHSSLNLKIFLMIVMDNIYPSINTWKFWLILVLYTLLYISSVTSTPKTENHVYSTRLTPKVHGGVYISYAYYSQYKNKNQNAMILITA